MASSDIKVVIESAVHRALAESIQHIANEHGLLVHDLHIDWRDVSQIEQRRFQVTEIRLRTSFSPGPRG